ncbi:AraC-like DNA-binding protein [Pedobacter sp. AK013]|uniref:helix-turn-helix domain-containing protein n=1 Tax=Pedobacter sp. AK013 TaxID=2723071 RepID=UPI00160893D0|nr:helix-turn-helix domain-containing protein [Pedobacter sp. AK013]MBB6238800.1 AraC-like DNA-binding protein [Pedobacter sp. AK013]
MSKTKSYIGHPDSDPGPENKAFVEYKSFDNASMLTAALEGDYFALILFESGTGEQNITSQKQVIKPQQICIYPPGEIAQWSFQNEPKGQILLIKRPLIETFPTILQFSFLGPNAHSLLDLDTEMYEKVCAEFSAINKELSASTVFSELVNARCRLVGLMITLWVAHTFGDHSPRQSKSIAYKFQAMVDKHFKTQKSVSFYANHLCITSNYLGVLCKKQYKMSALDFIQERVLLEAKRLLHSSDRSIKEIAFDLGFKSQTYFCYFFKVKTSLTPREYKIILGKS